MKKFEYRTITLLMPVDDKEVERDVEDAKERVKRAFQDGKEAKIAPNFQSFKQYQDRLNHEGKDGWQVVAVFPGMPSWGSAYELVITLMREIDEVSLPKRK